MIVTKKIGNINAKHGNTTAPQNAAVGDPGTNDSSHISPPIVATTDAMYPTRRFNNGLHP
jgi:hypothetical protein